MKPYPVQLEISGPIALWSRPDTLPNPVSYVAPTFSAVKGIFEAIHGTRALLRTVYRETRSICAG